jgi:hypothetical protein
MESVWLCECPGQYTTIIEWVLRVGLATVQQAGRIPEPWVGIMDFSIQSGKEKILAVLRLPLSHFMRLNRAPCLADCETISVLVRNDWNKTSLLDALSEVVERCGQPIYWLTDGGKDLAAAIKVLPKDVFECRKSYHVLDIGHFFANALKHMFASRKDFIKFLSAITKCAAKIRQTEFSQVTPPRIRTKGRFQSLERITDWFQGLREYIARQQRDAKTTFQARMTKFFAWSDDYVALAAELAHALDFSHRLQQIIKTQGLNLNTWPLIMKILVEVEATHPLRQEIEPYLRQCLRISNFLGAVPIILSDDVIETLFGILKYVTGEGKNSNFGRMALVVPTLSGTMDQARIDAAFAKVKCEDLRKYVKQNIPKTLLRRRRSDLRVGNIRRRRTGKKVADTR